MIATAIDKYVIFLLLLGCQGSVSEQECVDVHLHNVGIVAADPAISESMRQQILQSVVNRQIAPAMIESCMKNKSREQIQCEMQSATLDELSLCRNQSSDRG